MSLNNSNNSELIQVIGQDQAIRQYQGLYYEGEFIDDHPTGWCKQMYLDDNDRLVYTGFEVFFDGNGNPGQERPIQNNVEYNNNNLEANIYNNNENNNNYNEEARFKNIDDIGDDIKAKAQSFYKALLSYFNKNQDPTNEVYRQKIFGSQTNHRNDSILKDTLASFLDYNQHIANMDFNDLTTDIIRDVAEYVEVCYIYALSYKRRTSKFMLNENLKQTLVNGIYNLYDGNDQGYNLKQSLSNLIDCINNQDLDTEKQFLLANQNNVDVLNKFCEKLHYSLEQGGFDAPLDNDRVLTVENWNALINPKLNIIKEIIQSIANSQINSNNVMNNNIINLKNNINQNVQNNPSNNNPLNNNINQVGNNQFVNNLNLNFKNNQVNQNINAIPCLQPNNPQISQNNPLNNNPLNNNNFNMPVIHHIRNTTNNIIQNSIINQSNNLEDLAEQEYNSFIQDVLNNKNARKYQNKMIANPQRFQNMTNVCWLRRLFCCCSNPNEIELDNIVRKKIEANAVKLSCNDIIEQYRGI